MNAVNGAVLMIFDTESDVMNYIGRQCIAYFMKSLFTSVLH